MKTENRLLIVATSLAVAAVAAYASGIATVTLRTCGYFVGLAQATNAVTHDPQYYGVNFAGRNLVNLAMGRKFADTNVPNQVMAMTFACDLSSAELVVWDKLTSNVVATIASSTAIDSVKHQDVRQAGPNRAHFVAVLQLPVTGNPTNGLAGGYFTVAGRVNLNPVTGCPQPVIVSLDRDALDKVDDDIELAAKEDPDTVPVTFRTGLAHVIGVVDMVTEGATNTVLVPYGGLSIHRQLSPTALTSAVH